MSNKRPEAHDILLVPPLQPREEQVVKKHPGEYGPTGVLRMTVRADGQYGASELLDAKEGGGRKIYAIARPGKDYGPGFAILPIRPDPGTQSDTCYLINTENLNLPNPWTAADWDVFDVAGAGKPGEDAAAAVPRREWPAVEQNTNLLVATAKGKVYLVDLEAGKVTPVQDLGNQVAVWSQLREGLIVGTVLYEGQVTPLVNVASIKLPEPDGAANEGGAR